MMYRLFNYLFGWDYIHWQNTADRGIARVHVDGSGKVFYWRYKITSLVDVIRCPSEVLWLTCKPSKYFGEK